jgi:hypothetical protein
MNSFKESVINWFGYSRRERRSTFILLNIIVVVIGLRYFFPSRNNSLKEIPLEFLENKVDSILIKQDTQPVSKLKDLKVSERGRSRLNINSCDSASLEALPGIGPVLSSRIIRYRNLIGGYVSADQLKEVYGLTEETFNLILSRVWADSLSIRKIRINEADYRQLIRHPYFQKSEVTAILKYREMEGWITGKGVMIENNLISQETAKKIGPYLEFGK